MNILSLVLIAVFLNLSVLIYACDDPFEGFGIHLGSIDHFANSPNGTVQKVIDKVYDDLLIRYFNFYIIFKFQHEFTPISIDTIEHRMSQPFLQLLMFMK